MDGREREAAATLRECRRVLTAHGSTILHEVTEGAGDIAAWQRYPAGEVYDPDNHVQYFYHCHSPPVGSATGSEHGHFHLFLRAEGIPAEIIQADAGAPYGGFGMSSAFDILVPEQLAAKAREILRAGRAR